ncbi:MAG: bifunctional oligoribonuclease/PAP phosphatase NrnA [Clostridia bacterium]|nr:bifunctional oligoribonuclease/PAP phosphatase NrnA [Clostridia bacterium]
MFEEFEKAKKIIEKSNSIYMVAHINPDGDAIGSTCALYFALKSIGKDAHVICPSYSEVFTFLPGLKEAVSKVEKDEIDLLICLDASDNGRLAISEEDYKKAKKVIMLDHHQKSHPYGDVQYINDELSSACEIVYHFIKYLKIPFDQKSASLLYTGMMTDTGSFNYSNTSSNTHRAVAELLDVGIDSVAICKQLNDTIKEAKLKLIAKTIENMEVFYDGKMRYSYIDYETIKALGIHDEDAEGMTNYLRMVEGTEVAAYVRGKSDGTLKVSMRSGGNVDISKIAIEFGGGGHPRAAGYTMREDIEVEKKKLVDIVGVMLGDGTQN